MLWTQRLNVLGGEFLLGEAGRAQILSWNYSPALPDNLPHRHTYFEICLVGAHGQGEFRVDEVPHPIQSGDTFFARPGVIHQIVNSPGRDTKTPAQNPNIELFWVSFSLLEPSRIARDFAESDILIACDETVYTLWRALQTAAQAPISDDVLRPLCCALLNAILGAGGAVSPSVTPNSAHDSRVLQTQLALRYIHDNLSKKLSLPEIAAHIHVSPRQLVRLFDLHIGSSPARYIEHARLDRAQFLLLRSPKPIKIIAAEVGFEDVAHFSRVFSRRNGNPPGDFRQRGGPLKEQPAGANIQRFGDLV